MGDPGMQQGSKELYQAVRGALITNGTTLNRWCQENQVTRQWAEKALKGERRGVQSLKLLKRIAAVAGLNK
jgi:hypothetical protein